MQASDLQVSKLSLGPVKPVDFVTPLATGAMRFANILSAARRQIVIVLHGTVASELYNYSGQLSFFFEPAAGELENLVLLEQFCADAEFVEAIGSTVEELGYEQRPTINGDNHIRIKLKTEGAGWKFTCNDLAFKPDSDLVLGTPMTLTVSPGFYFCESDNRYGLFYTLKDLSFEKPIKRILKRKA